MKPILIVFVFTIITTVWARDTAVIHCPDIAYLGTSAQITCSTSVNFSSIIYTCPCGVAPQCWVSDCNNLSGYNASIINQTQTEITIISVQSKHAGNWSCTDAGYAGTTFCLLVVAKIPSVNITSDVDADSVNLGDIISLTVDIQDCHCSDAYSLTLQIGSATYACETGWNATVDNLTQTVPINATQAHFGNVTLVFVCGNHKWNITPGGVNELQQNRTTLVDSSVVSVSSGVLALSIVVAGASAAFIIIIIITIVCCYRRCRKQVTTSADTHTHDSLVVPVSQGKRKVAVVYPPSEDAVHQAEDNVVFGPGGSASGNDQQGPGLRINPVYVPTIVGDRIVTTGTSTETGVMGGDNLHPETRGEYVALDRNAVQPSNIYEHLTTYEEIANM